MPWTWEIIHWEITQQCSSQALLDLEQKASDNARQQRKTCSAQKIPDLAVCKPWSVSRLLGFPQGLSGQPVFQQVGHEKCPDWSFDELFLFNHFSLTWRNQKKKIRCPALFFFYFPLGKYHISISNSDFVIPEKLMKFHLKYSYNFTLNNE